jgi:hypothetical protein
MTTDQNKVVVVTADSQDLIGGQFSSDDDTSTLEESVEAGGTLCDVPRVPVTGLLLARLFVTSVTLWQTKNSPLRLFGFMRMRSTLV